MEIMDLIPNGVLLLIEFRGLTFVLFLLHDLKNKIVHFKKKFVYFFQEKKLKDYLYK